MPVILVTAPDVDDPTAALAAVNRVVTAALGLPPHAAHAVLIRSADAATGAEAAPPWPVAVVHGRARDEALMATALAALADVLARVWSRSVDEVWTQWAVKA